MTRHAIMCDPCHEPENREAAANMRVRTTTGKGTFPYLGVRFTPTYQDQKTKD